MSLRSRMTIPLVFGLTLLTRGQAAAALSEEEFRKRPEIAKELKALLDRSTASGRSRPRGFNSNPRGTGP
jgi:hypothetical protein